VGNNAFPPPKVWDLISHNTIASLIVGLIILILNIYIKDVINFTVIKRYFFDE